MPTLDPVYWISTPIFPSWGTKNKFIIPMIKYNSGRTLDWNYTRFLPDNVNYTNEKYYTPARMDNPKVNCSSDISHSLSSVPYNKWWLYPWESSHDADNYLVGGQDVQSGWDFWFQTSCSELPPESWSADPIENNDYRENGFNKWETHWYRMSIKLGNGTFVHTEFSNDGVYIQKYSLSGIPCHGAGSIDIGSTLQYYKPYQDGMFAIVGLYRDGFDPENPDPDYIEDFAIITNVNHPSSYEWNYFRLYGWENFEFHHEDDPDEPEPPSEDDMKIKKPYVGQFFNRQYCMTIGQCENFSSNLANLTGSVASQDLQDVIERMKGFYTGFTDWLANIVDLTIYPFDVYDVLNNAGARLLPVTKIRMGMLDYIFNSGGDEITCSAYRIADSNDILFDLTSWTLISRKFNDFRDFPPYRTGRLYLPFVGMVNFDLTNYYGKYIKVKYAVDISNGGCRAFVCVASSSSESDDGIIVASYDGQMGFHTPVTGADWSAYVNGITQALGNTISSAVSTGVAMGSPATGSVDKAVKSSNIMESVMPVTTSLNSLKQAEANAPMMTRGSSSPCLNNYTDFNAYFIWNEMKTTETSNLLQLQGYPSNKSGTLQSFSGFLSVSSCDLSCPKATEKERAMIMNALTSGIYI